MPRASLVLLVGLAGALACFVDVGGGGGTGSAGATTDDTSGGSTSTTGLLTTSTSTTTTTTTTTSTSTTATTDESTTGAPTGCWGAPIDAWDSIVQIQDGNLGLDPRYPVVTADGLGLLYAARNDPLDLGHRPRLATRAGLGDPFDVGVVLAEWPMLMIFVGHPKIIRDPIGTPQEMVLMVPGGVDNYDLWRSLWDGVAWGDPAVMVGFDSEVDEYYPTFSGDGARLIFARADGPVVTGAESLRPFQLLESLRPPGSAAGVPWGAPAPLALTFPEAPDTPHWQSCPVLADDGLRLFFTTSYPFAVDPNAVTDAMDIAFVTRASVDGSWSAPTRLPSLHQAGRIPCAGGVTADGCQLVYSSFTPDNTGPDPYTMWIATRSP